MLEAKPKFKTKTVWAGMYGGHYDQIVFFKTKPKKVKADQHSQMFPKGYYCCLENEDKIIGDMCLGDFESTFECDLTPYLENGRPKHIEIVEVFRIKLTGPFDEDSRLPFHRDWN